MPAALPPGLDQSAAWPQPIIMRAPPLRVSPHQANPRRVVVLRMTQQELKVYPPEFCGGEAGTAVHGFTRL